jgi:AraC family transcriptional regulator
VTSPAPLSRLPSGDFIGARSLSVETGGFKVGLWRAALPPEGVHEHVHEDAHFVLTLDGGYHSLAHDGERPKGGAYRAGSLIWNPPGVEHRDSFEVPGGRFLSVSFMPTGDLPQGDPSRLSHPRAERAARLLVGRTASFASGDDIAVESLALDMASAVLGADESGRSLAPPPWLCRARDAIEELAVGPDLEVRDIARIVGVHPVTLARRYRRHFGHTPGAAIRRARINRAIAALTRGAQLADLAAATGYADQSHLTREIRAFYGLSPKQLRAAFG